MQYLGLEIGGNGMAETLYEKIWNRHVVHESPGESTLLYIDLHLVNEVMSAQAFEGLRLNNRTVRRPQQTVAVMDHNVPTKDRHLQIRDQLAVQQMDTLA